MQARLSVLFRQHIDEIESIIPDSENLNSYQSEAKASVSYTTASDAKDTPQKKNTLDIISHYL